MDNLARKKITVEEYFYLEETSLERHEFYRGDIYAMSGATQKHNLIVSNLIYIFKNHFKNKNCVVYPPDMRVVIDEYNHYTYPDLTLVCGSRVFLDSKETTLVNPTVLIEVLSDSTEGYDRGKKFQSYRNIPSLQTYILVSTNYKQIEVFSKTPGKNWIFTEPDLPGIVHIPSLDFSLSLNEIYEGVEMEE